MFNKIGSTNQEATKTLDVLFAASFTKCDERQFVDSKKEQSSIECSYRGNPPPKLTWLRQSDQKPITSDIGIHIDTKDEHNGKYKSIVTFDRNRLTSNSYPITTTTTTATQEYLSGENYYQQLLNKGFLVKLIVNGNEKNSRNIHIVRDVNQIRANSLNNSIIYSYSSILFTFLVLLHIILQC